MTEKRTFVPSKQLSGKPMKFRKWSEYSVGDVVVCKYLKTTPNKFSPDRPNHVVEVIEAFLKDKKVQKELVEGTWLCLNSIGMFDKAVKGIESGSIIQFTYTGMETMKGGTYGGKEAHKCEVIEMVDAHDDDNDDTLIEDEEADL